MTREGEVGVGSRNDTRGIRSRNADVSLFFRLTKRCDALHFRSVAVHRVIPPSFLCPLNAADRSGLARRRERWLEERWRSAEEGKAVSARTVGVS